MRRRKGSLAHAARLHLLINLEIATLMFTPCLHVLASLSSFAAVARNWKYMLFTGFVLSVLTDNLFPR